MPECQPSGSPRCQAKDKLSLAFSHMESPPWRLRHISVENSSRPSSPPLHCTPNKPICSLATCRPFLPVSQPSLGVSSLDLGRSFRERPFFCAPVDQNRSAILTYAVAGFLHCNRDFLQFVRRTSKYGSTRPATSSLVSLPSLGVSSLDLGRSVHRAAPFLFSLRAWTRGSPPRRSPARCRAQHQLTL